MSILKPWLPDDVDNDAQDTPLSDFGQLYVIEKLLTGTRQYMHPIETIAHLLSNLCRVSQQSRQGHFLDERKAALMGSPKPLSGKSGHPVRRDSRAKGLRAARHGRPLQRRWRKVHVMRETAPRAGLRSGLKFRRSQSATCHATDQGRRAMIKSRQRTRQSSGK